MSLGDGSPASDWQGPFETEAEAAEYIAEHGMEHRPDEQPHRIGVPYHGEMTGDEAGVIWAGKIIYRD